MAWVVGLLACIIVFGYGWVIDKAIDWTANMLTERDENDV
jgi:hypothetical protein